MMIFAAIVTQFAELFGDLYSSENGRNGW